MTKKQHIVVGLSGGVDSAVTALLLKNQGYQVSGIYMQNWESNPNDPYCTATQDLSDAKTVCDQLDIPFHAVNFSKEYWDRVFQYCLDEFNAARTPNPDIWCNKEIKFDVFLKHAMALGADKLATGHYAQIHNDKGTYSLIKGTDPSKDQSYFLHALNQQQLKHTLFPLGAMNKTEVRKLAATFGFLNHDKKDSTGICFVGERHFKSFLSEFILAKPGPIITTDGQHIGQHDGLMFYTQGQRKGLNIGGIKNAVEKPWYVANKNIDNNELVVVQGSDHPLLHCNTLTCSDLHWITTEPTQDQFKCHAKIRYRQKDEPCTVHLDRSTNSATVIFDDAQWAITPGQSIVWYDGTICLGGGIIQGEQRS